jgi:hypothetical protein
MTVSQQNREKFEKMGVAFVRLDVAMGQFIQTTAEQQKAFEWLTAVQGFVNPNAA